MEKPDQVVRIVYGVGPDGEEDNAGIFVYGAFTDLELASKVREDLEQKIHKDWDDDEEIRAIEFPINKVSDMYYRTMELEDPNEN